MSTTPKNPPTAADPTATSRGPTSRPADPLENPYFGDGPRGATAAPWAGMPQYAPGPQVYSHSRHLEGDATGGIIPYKNPHALIAYYVGILSLLPVVGFPLGVASIFLGVRGLRARNRNPIIKGSVHAMIGIVLGLCGMPLHLFFGLGIVAGIASVFFV